MKCKIDGCEKEVMYTGDQICQMHYFRRMRYGTFELTRKPGKGIWSNPAGYLIVFIKGHPLADKKGRLSQHRQIVYDKYKENLPPCELCGKELQWSTVHIDHIDRNPSNNVPSNLRPLCRVCNTTRDRAPEYTYGDRVAITFDGITATAEEWSRDPRVKIHGATIRRRIRNGASPEEALFGKKKTHLNHRKNND